MKEAKEGFVNSEDGVKLHYQYIPSKGNGPTLVLCNGILCINNYWVYLMDYFKDRCPILTWDYRGHGMSELPEDFNDCTVTHHAKDLKAVMDAAGVEKAVLLGFSMGVQAVFEFYRHWPEKVIALIPISGGVAKPFNLKVGSDILEKPLKHLFSGLATIAPLLAPPLNLFLISPLNMPVGWLVGVDRHRAKKKDMLPYFYHIKDMNKAFGFKALEKMNEHSCEDVLDDVNVPTLIIIGDHDGMTPPHHPPEVQKKIRGSELFVVPHGNHTAIIENPEAINFRIDLFLRDRLGFTEPVVVK